MCGITGFLGNGDAFQYIWESLSLLQNRGYDSAGICSLNATNSFILHKYASELRGIGGTALEKLSQDKPSHLGNTSGIGHTRWATHGAKTDTNAHPHLDKNGIFSVVHNGIIENYLEIKEKFDLECISQTDTEVIAQLCGYFFKKVEQIKNISQINWEEDVIRPMIKELQGTWGLVILCRYSPDSMYLCKNGSPLVLGIDRDYALVSSEQLSLSKYFNHYIPLEDGDILTILRKNGQVRLLSKKEYVSSKINCEIVENLTHYHWTLKEILEQPQSIDRTLNHGGRILNNYEVKLGGLDSNRDLLLECDHCILLGCGTSLNAGYIGTKILKSLKTFQTVQAIDASEFVLDDIPIRGKTVFVLLSQSGETKDLHRCIEVIRKDSFPMIGIVNVVGSLIARETLCGIYLNAGREMGVASTKSFTSQVIALTLLAIWYSQNRDLSGNLRYQYLQHLRKLSREVEGILEILSKKMQKISQDISQTERMFILGRGQMQHVAEEASLKIKEIGYIHAEGYAGGSLKHGPFALIDEKTVVFLVAPRDDNFGKMINAAEEIHARGGKIFLVTNYGVNGFRKELFEDIIYVPQNDFFQSVLMILPFQLLAYYLALEKGHNPDFPRNLAKVVTVD